MKKIGFLLFFLTFTLCLGAQTRSISNISNVWSEVQNQQIAVHYVIDSKQAVDVTLQYSVDNGRTWFDCESVTGDLQAQTTGSKTILWNCRKDGFENGSLLFNVVLTPKSVLRATYKKNTFGLGVGIGSLWTTMEPPRKIDPDFNLCWTRNFSPSIGWDVFTFNFHIHECYSYRAMTGIRVYAPNLLKNMKGYAALNAGYAFGKYWLYDYSHAGKYRWDYQKEYEYQYHLEGGGFTYELEMGLHLNKYFFIGLTYSAHKVHGQLRPGFDYYYNYGDYGKIVPVSLDYFHNFINYAGIRIGLNL